MSIDKKRWVFLLFLLDVGFCCVGVGGGGGEMRRRSLSGTAGRSWELPDFLHGTRNRVAAPLSKYFKCRACKRMIYAQQWKQYGQKMKKKLPCLKKCVIRANVLGEIQCDMPNKQRTPFCWLCDRTRPDPIFPSEYWKIVFSWEFIFLVSVKKNWRHTTTSSWWAKP